MELEFFEEFSDYAFQCYILGGGGKEEVARGNLQECQVEYPKSG